MANVAGKAYGMTAITPMSPWKTWGLRLAFGAIHLGLFKADQVRLRNLSFIHFARWVIVPRRRFPRLSLAQPKESLRYDYLIFESNFNGTWEQYIDAFSDVIPGGMDHIWMWSRKFPGSVPVDPFLDYIRRSQSEVDYYYNAYPEATTNDIKMALRFMRELEKVASAGGPQVPDEFLRAYNALMMTVQTPPSDLDERTTQPPYALMLLSPIQHDEETRHKMGAHTTAIQRFLDQLPLGEASPLARVPTTHLARFVVLDDLPDFGHPVVEEHLRSAYLMFTSNFDGKLEDYIDAMADRMPEAVNALWGHCVGFPGLGDRRRFHRYMKQCQIKTTFFFPAYPEANVQQVKSALAASRAFLDLFAANQGRPPEMIQPQFQAFVEQIRASALGARTAA